MTRSGRIAVTITALAAVGLAGGVCAQGLRVSPSLSPNDPPVMYYGQAITDQQLLDLRADGKALFGLTWFEAGESCSLAVDTEAEWDRYSALALKVAKANRPGIPPRRRAMSNLCP